MMSYRKEHGEDLRRNGCLSSQQDLSAFIFQCESNVRFVTLFDYYFNLCI